MQLVIRQSYSPGAMLLAYKAPPIRLTVLAVPASVEPSASVKPCTHDHVPNMATQRIASGPAPPLEPDPVARRPLMMDFPTPAPLMRTHFALVTQTRFVP